MGRSTNFFLSKRCISVFLSGSHSMDRTTKILFGLFFLCMMSGRSLPSKELNLGPLKKWDAHWISHPQEEEGEYGVFLFKKNFIENGEMPEEYIIHVSADNRYKLFVNGYYITTGPARGDQMHWRYESINIAPYLNQGKNVVSAVVWNFGKYAPVAQHSVKTGFILQGDGKRESKLNTNETWKVLHSKAHLPYQTDQRLYLVTGAKEEFKANEFPWGWNLLEFDDAGFVPASRLSKGMTHEEVSGYGIMPDHLLVKRNIPLMEEIPQRFDAIRKTTMGNQNSNFITGEEVQIIPQNQQVSILVDQGHLTNAYPILSFSKGKGSSIKITYAESLVDKQGNKNNRNVVQDKQIVGESDIIWPDGGLDRVYETLWWRTFRYVQLDIETHGEELILNDFSSRFTGYPFKEEAQFKTNKPFLDQVWNVSWRTQRLCSGESYFDCPYYEQLQYIGDTRIQSLISTYVSGDVNLYKNAITAFQNSQRPFGLTQSRYPSREAQFIPTFSLIWITMLHDYWMLRPDAKFIEEMLPEVLQVLDWFETRKKDSGLLGKMEWWMFVDWTDRDTWNKGVPPGVTEGNSMLINLQYVYTLEKAREMFEAFGYVEQAEYYDDRIYTIQNRVKALAWDEQRGMFADTPDGLDFSQHTNIMAILGNVVVGKEAKALLDRILSEKDITKVSYYFSFYLMEALNKTGMGDKYLELLDPWKHMLDLGLTTFAEKPEPTRSDCHAWSASPMYFFLSLVCGIQSASPGFSELLVEPHLGSLKEVEGKMPHYLGDIRIKLKRHGSSGIEGNVTLPEGLGGVFKWDTTTIPLTSGPNNINVK